MAIQFYLIYIRISTFSCIKLLNDSPGQSWIPCIDLKCTRENELRERMPMPHDNFFNVFKVRARAAWVIFVCCFLDPCGLLSRERDMFRRQTFEV